MVFPRVSSPAGKIPYSQHRGRQYYWKRRCQHLGDSNSVWSTYAGANETLIISLSRSATHIPHCFFLCSMQLSKSGEFYPGTLDSQDRILLVAGTVDQLLTALHLVLSKLMSEPTALRAVQSKEGDKLQLRMLVHTRLCGTLIGKGGATIRSFNEDSHAAFNISPPPALPGLTERVVRISGDLDGLMRAVALVVTKLSENPDYHLLTDANLSYSVRFGGAVGGGFGGDRQISNSGNFGVHATTMTLAIPEDRVGTVIGKQGAVINQIKDLVKVSIRISKRGEHLPGTTDRACEITGSPEAVELAQRLIMQRMVGRN